MRLIDADKLLEFVDKYQKDNPHEDAIWRRCHDNEHRHFKGLINRQLTAFDKDRVLYTLHHFLDFYQGELDYSRAKFLEKIIDIIEGDGADG